MLRVGNPDSKGGRPRAEYREWARELLRDPAVTDAVRAVLTDPKNKNFAGLWKAVADRAFGPVVQRVKVKGTHEVRGVILLPEPSWGAPQPPQPQGAPQPLPGPASGPVALALSPGLLDTIADTVAASIASAADPESNTI